MNRQKLVEMTRQLLKIAEKRLGGKIAEVKRLPLFKLALKELKEVSKEFRFDIAFKGGGQGEIVSYALASEFPDSILTSFWKRFHDRPIVNIVFGMKAVKVEFKHSYEVRGILKKRGYRFDWDDKVWYKIIKY